MEMDTRFMVGSKLVRLIEVSRFRSSQDSDESADFAGQYSRCVTILSNRCSPWLQIVNSFLENDNLNSSFLNPPFLMTIIRREWKSLLKRIPFRCDMGAISENTRGDLHAGAGAIYKVIVMMTVSIGVYLPEVTCDFLDMKT
jgi:hypothetical protein